MTNVSLMTSENIRYFPSDIYCMSKKSILLLYRDSLMKMYRTSLTYSKRKYLKEIVLYKSPYFQNQKPAYAIYIRLLTQVASSVI